MVRNNAGEVRAFHNICRHRGNKLVWNDMPLEETSGFCRQFTCKYHAWRYDLDGNLTFVQQEGEFFDLDKRRYGLVPVHCDVWEGFIFVNFAPEPEQNLRDFLGPMITGLEGYPFGELTSRWYYRSEVKANWKLYMDAFQEFYHAPVLHANQSPAKYSKAAAEAGFEAPHYRIDGPHRLVSTSGVRAWEMDSEMRKPMEDICQSGLFGPWDAPDLGEMPAGLNPAKCDPVGPGFVPAVPELRDSGLGPGLVPHLPLLADIAQHAHLRRARCTSRRRARRGSASPRSWRRCRSRSTGCRTPTPSRRRRPCSNRSVVDKFLLCDQEVLFRHLHKETAAWVDDYQRKKAEV